MPDNIQTEALAVILIFPILSTLVIILRCYSRFLNQQFGWDDVLIGIAWLLAVGQGATAWIYTKLSWQGYHSWDIPEQSVEQQIHAQRVNLANQLLYNPILAIVKTSLIVFIFRLEDYRPIVRWNLYILFWVNLALMISIFLADLFQCTPLHYVYDYPAMDLAAQKAAQADGMSLEDAQNVKGGQCIGQIEFFLASAGMTILTDLWLLCIPTIIVWRLQMSRRKKVAVIAVLSMGLLVTVVGIARLVIYADRFKPNKPDRTHNIGHTISSVEVNCAIITASATALSALINRIAPRLWSSKNYASNQQQRGGAWTGATTDRTGTRRTREGSSYVMIGNFKADSQPGVSQEHIIENGGSSVSHKDDDGAS